MSTIPSGNQNEFFGQKVSIPGINVNNAGDNQLVYKNDFSTTTYYDGNGNAAVQLGKQSNGTYGLTFSGGTSGVTQLILGNLPDGTYGMVVSKPGISVYTLFS